MILKREFVYFLTIFLPLCTASKKEAEAKLFFRCSNLTGLLFYDVYIKAYVL